MDEQERSGTGEPRDTSAPNPLLTVLEGRAPIEALVGLLATPVLRRAPKGDGHPVLVLPPFGAADQFTAVLRAFLRNRGYDVHAWGHPEILGLHRLVQIAAERARRVRAESGARITLIGHSLGGVYAREVARFTPDDVRAVVTLGSPINDLKANHVWPMFEATSGTKIGSLPDEFARRMAEAPPVPTTAIHSRSDGVVAWRSCVDASDGQVENVEVPSSHVGMPFNPFVLYVVADRLAQPEGAWKPFRRPAAWISLPSPWRRRDGSA